MSSSLSEKRPRLVLVTKSSSPDNGETNKMDESPRPIRISFQNISSSNKAFPNTNTSLNTINSTTNPPQTIPTTPNLNAKRPTSLPASITPQQSTSSFSLSSLEHLFSKLLTVLRGKDSYGVFLSPVDTDLVNDYLTIIKQPMDFETMGHKLSAHQYKSLRDFQNDVELICQNAMLYNAPDTIYYKSASKLLDFGRKLLTREYQKYQEKILEEERRKLYEEQYAMRMNVEGGKNMMKVILDVEGQGEDEESFRRSGRKRVGTSPSSSASTSTSKKMALYRRAPDGSFLFTSLRKKGNISIQHHDDGSLNLGNDPSIQSFLVNSYHMDQSLSNSYIKPIISFGSSTLYPLGSTSTVSNTPLMTPINKAIHPSLSPSFPSTMMMQLGPFYSFSPFYETTCYPVNPFESQGLALAYGDPKGRAYIESFSSVLKHFSKLEGDSTNSEVGEESTSFLKNHIQRMIDTITLGGHSYVQKVDEWKSLNLSSHKKAIDLDKDQLQSTSIPSSPMTDFISVDGNHPSPSISSILSVPLSRPSTPIMCISNSPSTSTLSTATSLSNESLDVYDQIKSDLNQLARLLRWNKIEPEMEKLMKTPPLLLLQQFLKANPNPSPSIKPMDPLIVENDPIVPSVESIESPSAPSKKSLSLNTETLTEASKMLLTLQQLQNERFKSGKPSIISTEERQLVNEVKVYLKDLAYQVIPSQLMNKEEVGLEGKLLMEELLSPKPVLYSGTLPSVDSWQGKPTQITPPSDTSTNNITTDANTLVSDVNFEKDRL